MTREELTAKITRISELSGDNAEVMETLREIQDGYAEPEFTREQVYNNNGETWEQSYKNMVTKYRETFFAGDNKPNKIEETEVSEEIKFDDLFKED